MSSLPTSPVAAVPAGLRPALLRMPEPAWGRRADDPVREPAAAPLSNADPDPAGDPISDRYELEVRAAHLDDALDLAPSIALLHTMMAATVFFLFTDQASPLYLAALFLGVALPSAIATFGARSYRRRRPGKAEIATGRRLAALIALSLSVAWSTMPPVLFGSSDTTHKMYVVGLCTSLLATTYTFGAFRGLGLLFSVPIALASFGALFSAGGLAARTVAVLLLIYALFVIVTAGRMSRLSRERILDRVRVGEQNETISLLLHDFEENTSDWLWETDAKGRLQHVSERIAQVAGESVAALRNAPFEALFVGTRRPRPMGDDIAEILSLMAERKAFRERVVEVTMRGTTRWWRLSGKPIIDRDGHFLGFRGVGSDISETRQSEARIAYLASYDSLTGLANRARFHDAATQACAPGALQERPSALLYLDLDGFKFVNDTFGHALGDVLLTRVAQRLTGAVPPDALVSRLGGDEFAILIASRSEPEVVALGERLIEILSAPYTLGGVQVEIGASVGVARAPEDAQSPEALLGKADLALYRAKANGRGKVSLFAPDLEISVRLRRDLEADLKRALVQGEFSLHYQPLVGLSDGRIRTFEALLRWTRQSGATVSPADFVPVAEASGLITEIGRWVLLQACREAARWPADIRLAVNISPIQFRNTDLLADVTDALRASGLAPHRLEIEVTESVFFEMNATTIGNLNELRALGIRVALDDFGTGYSSLSYLIRFPVDKIKIDRSFIREMGSRPECLAIIEAILTLAHKLAITVTAEGVETVEQAQMLKASRCDDIQGFLFSPGRPADAIPHLIGHLPVRFGEIFPILPVTFRKVVA
ncbi:bifunctional diguanylate cyclase/phosphodiesterase [Methylobacterium sp.]|jgi:diguanylate cyclase (GGDEF)-like protein/PAS domain S-box-containing protein|uniref:putative bifunctional diguanylate cyclase/phosphodiesterase n=1 Tax=Methylobacterium sp. TaxID=409 RepID=UPI0025E05B9D|nr:GGDEF and EAL domain-containing protein [Methylobacterium sp.]MBY0256375.1 EAL domain-containing protein [Methylobacterium sp.]